MRAPNATRGRLTGVAVAAGLATALIATVGGAAGAAHGGADATDHGSAAPTWTYSPDEPVLDGDIAARAVGESVGHAEAERRLRADRAASHVQDVAQARWPATFAGLWIDHAPTYRVNIAFTRDAAANVDELRASFPYPDDLHAVDALLSLHALSLLQEAVAGDREAIQRRSGTDVPAAIRATRGVYDHSIDVAGGRVVVRVTEPTAALRDAFRRRYGTRVAVTGGSSAPRACAQADCRYAMMGGLRLAIGGTWCSSAFTAYYTNDPSIRYVLSAGHCYSDTGIATRANGGSHYGSTTSHKLSYEVDAERVRRDGSGPWRESSKFYVEGETYPRLVTSVTSYSSMAIGAYVGKTGYTTGTTRGYITSKTSAPWWVTNARNFVEADMCSDGGDSGSAVWRGNSAYGILSGGSVDTSCRNINGTLVNPAGDSGTTIFGAVSYATAALGVTILTGVNLKPTAEFTSSCLLLNCSFDASASSDDDGGITSYAWNFGDGTTGTGKTTTHSYGLPGLYTVTLTTKDNNGATTSKPIGIAVTAS